MRFLRSVNLALFSQLQTPHLAPISMKEDEMRRFRTRIFVKNSNWFFRWDNIDFPTAHGVTPPLRSQHAAESRMHEFVATELRNFPWTVFERA